MSDAVPRRAARMVLVFSVVAFAAVHLAYAGGAFDEPISSTYVDVAFTLPDGTVATVSVVEGMRVDVTDNDAERTFAFAPLVDDIEPNSLHWLSLEVLESPTGEKLVPLGAPRYVGLGQSTTFQLTVSGQTDLYAVQAIELGEDDDDDVCCVTCGRWTICGRSVELWCDSCDTENP